MNKESRVLNSSKNAVLGIISQMIILILGFVVRAILIRALSQTDLGINSIFTNIISLLSVAELGIGNVLIYQLYKPIYAQDKAKITQLLTMFKKIYVGIAIFISVSSLILIPFFPYLLNGVHITPNIIFIYLLFVGNTVSSYLFFFRQSLIVADQKNYIVVKYNLISVIIKSIFQILVLFFFKSFILYLIVSILSVLGKNILIAHQCKKRYPYILESQPDLSKLEKKEILQNTKHIFIYKLSTAVLYGSDSLIISALLTNGTIIAGLYSNYLLVTESLNGFLSVLFTSFTASIGNLNVSGEQEKKYTIFKSLNLAAVWIYGMCAVCFLLLIQPFISIYAGNNYLLDYSTVIIIALLFYISGIFTPIWIFRETAGLFSKSKNSAILLAIVNIVLSIVLGYFYGINGILGATILSRLMTNFWYEPYLILKNYLKKSVWNHWKNILLQSLKVCIAGAIVYGATIFIPNGTIILFLAKGIVAVIVFNLVMLLLSLRNPEYQYILGQGKNLFSHYKEVFDEKRN